MIDPIDSLQKIIDDASEGACRLVLTMDYYDRFRHDLELALSDDEIKCIIIDVSYGVEIPGTYDWAAMIARHEIRKSKAKPQPDYLKHDPTKRWKGR